MAYNKQWNNRPSAARVSNRQMRRNALATVDQHKRTYAILLSVLAQCGGEVVVGKDAVTIVGNQLAQLRYDVVSGTTSDTFIVRMTTAEENTSDSREIEAGDSHVGNEQGDARGAQGVDDQEADADERSAGDSPVDAY